MPLYRLEKLKYGFSQSRASFVVVALVPASLVIALQASLYPVNEKCFKELDALCSTSVTSCPNEDLYQTGELSRSKIQLENIAILLLHLWVLCTVFVAVNGAQLLFTFVQLLSRPAFFVGQVVRTTNVRSRFPAPSTPFTLRFRLEVVELVVWIVFVGGFIWYTYECWKHNRNVREIWQNSLFYPLMSSLSFFATEISLRRPPPFLYISIAFLVVTMIMAVVFGGMCWYYRRSAPPRIKIPNLTIAFGLPQPVQIPRASVWTTSIEPTAPLARVSEDTGVIDQREMLETSGSRPSYHDVNVAPVQHPTSVSLNNGPNFEDRFSASVTPIDIDTHSPVSGAASESLPTPSTVPPSPFRSPPPSFTSRAPSISQLSRNGSFNSVTTLPSYRSRRSTLALPPSALPQGSVRELPPLPIITVTGAGPDGPSQTQSPTLPPGGYV
ncbi:hypothetical protein Moror_8264 [Moniliophthora roreri MCA 2997]|uniref:Uncharacterized protein n=1 Tax=Moniliophthora roreri (strain MCA 2997) TaxID=1381753 RepID=V2YRI6_MONRO|nr:hypothetical protein Moror_8264 [Moniliophthora roreri MCA 2997]